MSSSWSLGLWYLWLACLLFSLPNQITGHYHCHLIRPCFQSKTIRQHNDSPASRFTNASSVKSFWRRSLHPAWKSQHSPRLMALMSWLVRAFFWKNFLLLSILQRRTGNMIYLSTVGTCRIRTHPNPSFLPLPTAQISQSTDPVLPELIPPMPEWVTTLC